jgi:hypothetical protein
VVWHLHAGLVDFVHSVESRDLLALVLATLLQVFLAEVVGCVLSVHWPCFVCVLLASYIQARRLYCSCYCAHLKQTVVFRTGLVLVLHS